MISTQYIKLNMTPSGALPVLYCSQYDIGRPLGLVVHNGSEPVDLDTYTATIEATRTDGTPIAAAVTTDDNIGVFVTTAEMTNKEDKYFVKLVLFDSNSRRVASLAFVMVITPATMDENAEPIQEDRSLYEQYTAAVQSLIAEIRADIADLQDEKIQRYDTVAQMTADTSLKSGMYARTGGYSAVDDGGTGLYKIRTKNGSETTDAFNVIQMSDASLVAQLITSRTAVTNFKEFVDAINDGNQNSSYHCTEITIESTTTLTERTQCSGKSFSDATFTLNTDMFQWTTMSDYHAIPSFVNCTFIGNGHSICKDGAYILGGRFVNCTFIDCSLVTNGYFAQSQRFVNCVISNAANHTFIHCERIYDIKFIGCQVEADNKSPLINAYNTASGRVSVSMLSFTHCIIEGQSTKVIIMHDGSVKIEDCYTEALADNFVQILPSTGYYQMQVQVSGSRLGPNIGIDFINIDSSYFGKPYTRVVVLNSSISLGNLINSDYFRFYIVENMIATSGGTILPSRERAYLGEHQVNLVADLSNAAGGTMIVKKFPALISFDSSIGGWHTNLYLVSLGTNNTPNVKCISDPTKTPTAAYDSETGYVTVTMHESSSSTRNRSAIWLPGIINDYNTLNYWYKNGVSGYQA